MGIRRALEGKLEISYMLTDIGINRSIIVEHLKGGTRITSVRTTRSVHPRATESESLTGESLGSCISGNSNGQ